MTFQPTVMQLFLLSVILQGNKYLIQTSKDWIFGLVKYAN